MFAGSRRDRVIGRIKMFETNCNGTSIGKLQTGTPVGTVFILPLLVPLEFLSNILIRPITLSLRLFANMFAGHLLLLLFSTGGAYLLLHATGREQDQEKV